MESMQDIEWLDPLVEHKRSRELEAYARQKLGISSRTTGFFAPCPWVMRADIDLATAEHVHIGHELSGLAALVVSRDNSCRFCFAASRMILRLMGMPEDRIGKLEEDLETAQLDTPVRLALDLARRISRSNPLPSGADKKTLRDAGYGEDAIKELAFIAAENVFHNRVATLPALPPRGPRRGPSLSSPAASAVLTRSARRSACSRTRDSTQIRWRRSWRISVRLSSTPSRP